ncbi:hypothetical protein MA16_Dca026466 [Dendrobium catenatum]|uniref:DUF8041 domain-containing protein n=1 Tax=Dendrobium catenatum TaxID=906689 RepID=A0A2I0WA19_9ASPA|nr:hypothetical protein MA16_Dca026466 [Dendrobium catenatum]
MGAWFFFNFYFKPLLYEKSKAKIIHDESGFSDFDKSDLRVAIFLVQYVMEKIYMWVFKESPNNNLAKQTKNYPL